MKPIDENEKHAYAKVKAVLDDHELCFDRLQFLALALDRDYDPDFEKSITPESWVELFSDDPELMREELEYSGYRVVAAKKSIEYEKELSRLINNKLGNTSDAR